jgi:hypothetical protein
MTGAGYRRERNFLYWSGAPESVAAAKHLVAEFDEDLKDRRVS